MITPIHIAMLMALATYYALTRRQVQTLCCPTDKDGRATRYRLLQLVREAKLIGKTHMEVCKPEMGAPAPVYYLLRKGAEFLQAETGDERYLSTCCQTPTWMNLHHTTEVSQLHIELDRAIAAQDTVKMEDWLGEWDVADVREKEPHKRYRLFTLLREKPRLVCAPDAGFVLDYLGYRKAYYLELDRATSGIKQIASSKTPGYCELVKRGWHRRIFETVNVDSFTVLSVSPTAHRRDALRKAIATKDGASLWRFSAWTDFRPERVLHSPIWFPCDGEPAPLVKRLEGEKQ